MKKKIFIMLIFMGMIFSYTKAYAITGSFEYDNFKYNVKKIHLDVYKSKLDDDNNFIGYEDGDPIQVIDIADEKTITPKYLVSNVENGNQKAVLVSLNLNVDKEEMLSLLKEKITTVDKDNHYYIRMVVDLSFETIPSEYKYFYNISYKDRNNDLVYSTDPEKNSLEFKEIEAGDECSQVFSVFEYKLDSDAEKITYATTYSEDIPVYADFMLDSVRFSEINELGPNVENRNAYAFAFVAYDNMEEYLLALDKSGYYQELEDYNKQASAQVVEVPDTAMNTSKIIYIVGGVVLLIGCSIVGSIFIKNKI